MLTIKDAAYIWFVVTTTVIAIRVFLNITKTKEEIAELAKNANQNKSLLRAVLFWFLYVASIQITFYH